jgi:uncharacterized coiled-coil protein SlyX
VVSDEAAVLRARLTELEVRYTHLTDVVDQLSELVRAQQGALDEAWAAIERLARQAASADDEPGLDPGHERPPHY